MAWWRPALGGGALAVIALGIASLSAEAATPPKQPPRVFQVTPTKINPRKQLTVLLVGQNLTASTRVTVGDRPAATVEAPDTYHLLVKLPDDLREGAYLVRAANEAGSITVDEPLLVHEENGMNRMTLLVGSGLGALVLLLARMARAPILK